MVATLNEPANVVAAEPTGSLLDHSIAHVVVPPFLSQRQDRIAQYASTLQAIIRQLDEQHACAWIVDLRANRGGNMWPMLAGVGPLLDGGALGSFRDATGSGPDWSYHDGAAWLGTRQMARIQGNPYELRRQTQPVAVLVGPTTASSGEAVAIAFRGNRNTRLFGERTRGLTTANASFPLRDGALLNVAAAIQADRTGHVYLDGMVPDDEAKSTGTTIPDIALGWLQRQPACASR